MVAPVRRFIYTVSRLCDLFPSVLSQTEMDHGWYLDPVAVRYFCLLFYRLF